MSQALASSNYPWLAEAWANLAARFQQQQLPHAILLTGAKGLGKLALAQQLAQTLFCQAPQGAVACGECRSCNLFLTRHHPDYSVLEPEEGSEVIKIDQVRTLLSQLMQTAQQGGYRVIVVPQAQAFNTAAANALLKTLEEPMPKIVWILLSDKPTFIPATIRSRCQWLKVHVTPAQAEAWCAARQPLSPELTAALALSDNAPLQAEALVEQKVLGQYQQFWQAIAQIYQHQVDPMQVAAAWHKQVFADVLMMLQVGVMDLVRLSLGAPQVRIVNRGLQDTLLAMSQSLDGQALFDYLEQIQDLQRQVSRHLNPNTQLVLENLLAVFA